MYVYEYEYEYFVIYSQFNYIASVSVFVLLIFYTGSAKYLFFGKCFKKKITEYFLKLIFLFESTILSVNNGK